MVKDHEGLGWLEVVRRCLLNSLRIFLRFFMIGFQCCFRCRKLIFISEYFSLRLEIAIRENRVFFLNLIKGVVKRLFFTTMRQIDSLPGWIKWSKRLLLLIFLLVLRLNSRYFILYLFNSEILLLTHIRWRGNSMQFARFSTNLIFIDLLLWFAYPSCW